MTSPHRLPPPPALESTGVVAVLRTSSAERYEPVVRALSEAGVRSIELTLTTPGTLESLPRLLKAVPDAEIGVGTVRNAADADAAIQAGAQFLVTPIVALDAAIVARSARTPILMGALTPTEVVEAWDGGATAVKVFPASTVGPSYFRHLSGPLPEVRLVPSGGVGIEDCRSWIAAGAVAVSLGAPLLGDALDGGDLHELQVRARQVLETVWEAQV